MGSSMYPVAFHGFVENATRVPRLSGGGEAIGDEVGRSGQPIWPRMV